MPNSLLQSLRADSIALSRQLSGAGLSDNARRTLPLPVWPPKGRAKDQSNGGDGRQGKQKWNKERPKENTHEAKLARHFEHFHQRKLSPGSTL